MILQGDTIRLKVYFKTFDGDLIDPTDITLTIYDADETEIEQFSITDSDKEKVGVYFYNYETPLDQDKIIFEFKGTYNNHPILVRDELKIQFTK